jgi:hypothetical protein
MSGRRTTTLAAGLLCALVLAGGALAAALSGYALPWQSVNSAGGQAESAKYALDASLGQTAAGQSGNSVYRLSAGFWPGAGPSAAETATPTSSPSPTATLTPTPTSTPWATWLPMIMRTKGG